MQADRVVDGEAAAGTIEVVGRRRGPAVVVDRIDGAPVRVIVPRTATGAPLALPGMARGRYRLGPLVLVTTDPLGLVRVTRAVGGEGTLWVHPRVSALRPHRTGGGRQSGLHLQAGSPHGIELHRLEDYLPGDDPRLIHWPTSMRRGSLVVRHPARDHRGDVLVVLDTAVDSYDGDEPFEDAVRVVASIVLALAPVHESVWLETSGGLRVTVDASIRRRVDLLDALAAVGRRRDDPGLDRYRPRSPRSTLVALTGIGRPGHHQDESDLVTALSRHVDGLSLLRVGPAGGLIRPRPRAGPAFEVISAPTSDHLLSAWLARAAS
jgi:uncharacterized protein (DUF58 family)